MAWRIALALCQDPVGIEEIESGIDLHTENIHAFGLPSRLIAKRFLFRNIFKGTAYGYAIDPDFAPIGNAYFWQNVIDRFYKKYPKMWEFHEKIISEVQQNGVLVSSLTGRVYRFDRGPRGYNISEITNHPVQGGGADVMKLVRKMIHDVLLEEKMLMDTVFPILTVHDSVMYDIVWKRWVAEELCAIIQYAFQNVHKEWKRYYGTEIAVPMGFETSIGVSWKQLHVVQKG